MCDDTENLAGAGTDVRRCSDALGPRKNLQGVPLMGVNLIGVNLIGEDLMGVPLIGEDLMGMRLMVGVHLMGVPLNDEGAACAV